MNKDLFLSKASETNCFISESKILLNWNPSFQFASLSSDLANRLHK